MSNAPNVQSYYSVASGTSNSNPFVIFFTDTSPSSTDINFPVQKFWYNLSNQSLWILTGFSKVGEVTSANWEEISVSGSPIDFVTDSGTATTAGDTINLIGAGLASTSGSGDTITITVPGGGLSWSVVIGATQSIAVSNGYFANAGGGVTFTLPASASEGDTFAVSSINAGGWTLSQNAGQTVHMGNQDTTTGAGGSLASTAIGDTITMVCSVQDTDFVVVSSMGNITVV